MLLTVVMLLVTVCRIAAKLSSGFDQSRKQRALVESFLDNHEEVPKTDHWYGLLA